MIKQKLIMVGVVALVSAGLLILDINLSFELIFLPALIFFQVIILAVHSCFKRYRDKAGIDLNLIAVSVGVLLVGCIVGSFLNKKNMAIGMDIVAGLEQFKASYGKYPDSLSDVPSLTTVLNGDRLYFRARYGYHVSEDGSFFLDIQTFPIGFVKWNAEMNSWEDEML